MDAAKRDRNISFVIVGLCVLGAAFMGYLVSVHYDTGGSSLCNLGAAFNCHIVNQSIYAELLGIPVSILGLGYFLAVAGIALTRRIRNPHRLIALITASCLVFSIYLSIIEVMVLGTICIFCEASKLVMLLILGIAFWHANARKEELKAPMFIAAIAVGMIFVAVARWLQAV